MSKQYAELLKTDEWKNKRFSIMKRDNFTCQHCRSKKEIQVHHKKYIKGKLPWEVPNKYLITLCKVCHQKQHDGKHISQFVLNPKNGKPKSNKSKMQRKIENMYKEMSIEDKKIQMMYDKQKEKSKK